MIKDKYTMSIYNMLERHIKIFDFDYPLDSVLKPEFENAFISYYMFSEIFCYFPTEFKQRLYAQLCLKSEYYNRLFEASRLKYNPLINKSLKEHGATDKESLNIHEYASLRSQISDMFDELKAIRDENYKQNIEEAGETTGLKDTTTDDHLTRDTEEKKKLDKTVDFTEEVNTVKDTKEDIIVDGTLDKTVDSVKTTDSTTNVVTDGTSEKKSNLSEKGTSSTTNRFSDTPQNNLGQLTPTEENMFNMYLTKLDHSANNTTHTADSTEDIKSHEDKDTVFHEDMEGKDTTKQTTKDTTARTQKDTTKQDTTNNEKTGQTELNTEEVEQQEDIIYHETTEGTHHFINDNKSKRTQQDNTIQTQKNASDSKLTGDNTYHLDEKQKDKRFFEGFEGTSLSNLVNEYYGSIRNIIEQLIGEFENLFMGIF